MGFNVAGLLKALAGRAFGLIDLLFIQNGEELKFPLRSFQANFPERGPLTGLLTESRHTEEFNILSIEAVLSIRLPLVL